MNKALLLALGLLAVCAAVAFAGGEKDAAQSAAPKTGSEKGIAIMPLVLDGFTEDDSGLLDRYVRGVLTDNINNYSGMMVNSIGDTGDYYLEIQIQKHPDRYSLSMMVGETGGADVLATGVGNILATSQQLVPKLDRLMYGTALNKATKDLLTGLGVTLTAAAIKALDEPLDSRYGEGVAALAKASAAPEASFRREQNANVAEDLGASLARAGLQLSDSSGERFELPEFSAPQFAALTFKPPTIRTFSTSTTGAALQADLARYRAAQAASKAAIEEQQQYLLGQRADILDQWQNFLGEIDRRHQFLQGEEDKLFQTQAALEAQLREGEANYRDSPPFRILYTPEPKVEADLERGMANLGYQIAAEPTSLRALKARVDNLLALNKSFENVNQAYEDVNRAMDGRFAQVEAAMNAVKDAMEEANAAGSELDQNHRVDPLSPDWTIPPGVKVYGAALKTSWPVDYLRTFDLTVCLLSVIGDEADVIERMPLSLTNDFSWNGPFQPESASARGSFNDVKIDDLPEEGFLTLWIEAVNGIDAETAAVEGYIEIIPDGARTAAVGRQIAARGSWRNFWSDTGRLNSLGVAVGTTTGLTPAFLVSAKVTFSPFSHTFLEAGSDFGLVHGERDVQDVGYFSIAPYLHFNALAGGGNKAGAYIGVGGGASFSQYTYPSESHIDPVTVFTPVLDANIGLLFFPPHSAIDVRWTVKTNFKNFSNFKGLDHRFTLGYAFRFGYFAKRFGGKPADLAKWYWR